MMNQVSANKGCCELLTVQRGQHPPVLAVFKKNIILRIRNEVNAEKERLSISFISLIL